MRSSSSLPFDADHIRQIVDYPRDTEKLLQRSIRGIYTDRRIFRQEMLDAHNYYRARHCVPPLVNDTNLTVAAQNYSDYLIRTNKFVHSGVDEGENLAAYSNTGGITGYTGKNHFCQAFELKLISLYTIGQWPTDRWYNEVSLYNYNQPGFTTATGHFTQLVWKDSTRLGVGISYNVNRTRVVVVARYSPPGNYEGEYQDNVLRPNC